MTFETALVYTLLFISLYFEVFVLISFIVHKKKGGTEKHTTQNICTNAFQSNAPSVTITVPCYNEEKTLAKTVNSLIALRYPSDKLAITIVNDGSSDNTSHIAHTFAKSHAQITVLDKENGGKASAMNLALSKSKSDLIGCLDADSTVAPDALLQLVKHFKDETISAVTPAIMIIEPKNILQMMQRAEYMMGIFIRKVFSMLDSIIVTPGPFSIFRRSAVLELGEKNDWWKHAHGTEDFEMGLRMQSNHKRIANEPLAKVMTLSPATLYDLYRQRIRWVYGFLMNALDYKHMIGNPHYGHVGLFVLPTAILSIFGAVVMFGIFIFNLLLQVVDIIVKLSTIGITVATPRIEWFYINTSATLFIVITLIGMVLAILHNASKLAETKVHTKDTALYLLIYGLVAPLWLTGATVRAVAGKESKWRVVR